MFASVYPNIQVTGHTSRAIRNAGAFKSLKKPRYGQVSTTCQSPMYGDIADVKSIHKLSIKSQWSSFPNYPILPYEARTLLKLAF